MHRKYLTRCEILSARTKYTYLLYVVGFEIRYNITYIQDVFKRYTFFFNFRLFKCKGNYFDPKQVGRQNKANSI